MENIYTKNKIGNSEKVSIKAKIAHPSLNSILIIKQFARTYSPSIKN